MNDTSDENDNEDTAGDDNKPYAWIAASAAAIIAIIFLLLRRRSDDDDE